MKVKIGGYVPHWNAHTLQRWYLEKKYKKHYWDVDEEQYDRLDWAIDKASEWWQDVLNSTINEFFAWRGRKIKVRIDRYDTWGMDHTLAIIIHPMLIQLKNSKHGAPFVDDEDVPEELRSTSAPPKKSEWDTDDNHFKRWDWVLDEMIWTFEQLADEDSDNQFYSGTHDITFEKVEGTTHSEMVRGPNDTFKIDHDGLKKFNERINNGTRLFGKYFRNLWD